MYDTQELRENRPAGRVRPRPPTEQNKTRAANTAAISSAYLQHVFFAGLHRTVTLMLENGYSAADIDYELGWSDGRFNALAFGRQVARHADYVEILLALSRLDRSFPSIDKLLPAPSRLDDLIPPWELRGPDQQSRSGPRNRVDNVDKLTIERPEHE